MKSVHHQCSYSTRRFGWFSTKANTPHNEVLNYLSVALAVVRVFLFAFVRPAEEAAAEPVRSRALSLSSCRPLALNLEVTECVTDHLCTVIVCSH